MARTKPTVVGANSAPGTSVPLPAHEVGQTIVLFVYRDGNNTPPTKPTAADPVPAWADIDTANGSNSNSCRTAWFKATRNDHTSGVWTNAAAIVAVVVDGQDTAAPIGGHASFSGAASNQATAADITQAVTDGSSLKLEFFGHRTVTSWGAAPAGYTRLAATDSDVCCNSKDNTATTDSGVIQTATTSSSSGFATATVEILGDPKYTNRDENIDRDLAPVPDNISGCYVTLNGAGGGGGSGGINANPGGDGGGGGARVARVFIPKSLLGPTFSVKRGFGGVGGPQYGDGSIVAGTPGGDSVFTSGSVSLTAGGGGGGERGKNSTGAGGAGGVASATGVTATLNNGTRGGGGVSNAAGGAAPVNPNGAAAGGGAGGNGNGPYSGGDGGDSATVTGGDGGVTPGAGKTGTPGAAPSNAAPGNGGAGGGGGSGSSSSGATVGGHGAHGGLYGGGGGGGGTNAGSLTGQGAGGNGADGYTLVEWVTSPGTFFPFITAA